MSTIDDLTEQEQRLIAADFAERVLPLFEAQYPDDDRPRKSIEAVRAYARGEITEVQLSAAGSAAWYAAGAAARAAATTTAAAAAVAAANAAALGATWSAAASAARAAAGAAGSAERAAERAWQQQRINELVAARAQP